MPDPLALVIAAVVTFLAAAVQGTIGFGLSVVSVPILTLVDPALTPVPQLMLAFPISIAAVVRERHHIDLTGVGWIMLGRLPGALLGAWLLSRVADRILDGIIGTVVLLAVVAIGVGVTVRLTRRNRILAGVVSGFTGTTSAIGGPPLALLYRSAEGGTVRSSLGVVFSVGLVINLSALWLAGAIEAIDLRVAFVLLPSLMLGFALSSRLRSLVEGQRLQQAILATAGLASAALLIRASLG